MKNNTERNCSTKQERLPEFIAESLEICDPVLVTGMIIDCAQFKHGHKHHISVQHQHYKKLVIHAKKLGEYVEKLRICRTERNS